jgi:hypothetical protein
MASCKNSDHSALPQEAKKAKTLLLASAGLWHALSILGTDMA